MESLLAWVKENVSPTASLENVQNVHHIDSAYRKGDGSWYEPIPSPLHWTDREPEYTNEASCHSFTASFVSNFREILLGDIHSVTERVEFEGHVFCLSKAIIFSANFDVDIEHIKLHEELQKMDLKVLPKELSSNPSHTFCIVQPLNVCNFFSTFRAWLILNGYDSFHNRSESLIEEDANHDDFDYFWDILWYHDDFFANLGTRKDDLEELVEFYAREDMSSTYWTAFTRELKHLWAMYLWARLRKKMIQWGKYGPVLVSLCKEVQARPGNSDWKSAKRSFEMMAEAQKCGIKTSCEPLVVIHGPFFTLF